MRVLPVPRQLLGWSESDPRAFSQGARLPQVGQDRAYWYETYLPSYRPAPTCLPERTCLPPTYLPTTNHQPASPPPNPSPVLPSLFSLLSLPASPWGANRYAAGAALTALIAADIGPHPALLQCLLPLVRRPANPLHTGRELHGRYRNVRRW